MINFTSPHSQAYYRDAEGQWRADLALQGVHVASLSADSDRELTQAVCERLRLWVASADVDGLGELLEQLGEPSGAPVLATRRLACEARLLAIETGL